ncbi:MAG: glutaredoxin family protein [Deltaproteobacteria bacterium]|uniref:Glutaredoxin family protein n=1 Tax=Candidatus Zymogenus saltonus TaxID=2844893 RepID=A0A9D8PIH9_9DELT|nr:glutaredoxin family protein [Candidatus Zymogenus saltonus]
MGKSKVVIYTTPTCPYCNRVREFFKDSGIDFTDYDVTKEERALAEMRKLTENGERVPVINIGGEIIIGFDESRIEGALKKYGEEG